MKKQFLIVILVLFLFGGCASDTLQTNQLRNLTEKQSDWFGRTSESWAFK